MVHVYEGTRTGWTTVGTMLDGYFEEIRFYMLVVAALMD
jgi:hypothetical protein